MLNVCEQHGNARTFHSAPFTNESEKSRVKASLKNEVGQGFSNIFLEGPDNYDLHEC